MRPDVPDTVTYIEDFGGALVTLGQRDEVLGEVWHVPNAETVTMRRFVQMGFESAGHPSRLRAVKEQHFQSERPWVVDSTKFEPAFGWTATPLRDAIAGTVAWFRADTADWGSMRSRFHPRRRSRRA
jgi:nucleoside-diphosphate-sugar epimerase